ncbi:MAG TPA: hypothetical protein VKH37_04040 [Ferruginibacter sp.]|nr:hypothetical protein [Ferruginibacter sp.]
MKVHALKGERICSAICFSGDVIIRLEDADPKPLQRVDYYKDSLSYKMFGDIGINGALKIQTRQSFDNVMLSNIEVEYPGQYIVEDKKLFFLNGYLAPGTLKVARNAIKRVEVLDHKNYKGSLNDYQTILINVSTVTKEEEEKRLKSCSLKFE